MDVYLSNYLGRQNFQPEDDIMSLKSKFISDSFDFNTLAEKEWSCPEKGLRKELVNFTFISMTKPTEISKCFVSISDVRNLNGRESNYLAKNEEEFWVELGSALTPIDVYIEIILQQMLSGESSRCYIKTKSEEEVSFVIKLSKIDFRDYLYKLNVREMFDLSMKYKENGVAMFKKYPVFAQEYFCRAAKCLISFKPFEVLSLKADSVDPNEMEKLLQTIQLNIAACLIKQKKFENVVYLTDFIENCKENSEKGIYRRATAFYNLKKYSEAKRLIEIVDYKEKPEFLSLYNKILFDWKTDTERYNSMVKKMFG